MNLLTGTDRPVGPPITPGQFNPASLARPIKARNGSSDVVEASWKNARGALTVRLSSGATIACSAPKCRSTRIASVGWRPNSADVVVTFVDRDGRQSLDLWTPRSDALRELAASDGLLDGDRYDRTPCALTHALALCVAAEPASPPRLDAVDLATGERLTLFDPNLQLRSSYAPITERLHFRIPDGREGTAVIIRPRTDRLGRRPLYVNYYSCEGFLRGGVGDEWPIPQLVDAGFVTACINAIPSAGPQNALFEYRTGLAAVRRVIDRLANVGLVDRSRVAMGGLSFGSEVGMWTAIHSRLLAALSISSAELEPTGFWMSSMPGSDQPSSLRSVWGLGKPEDTPKQWKRIAPALNTRSIDVPTLFQLPEQEARRIPELFARLAATGTPTELYAFPDEAHIKLQPRHRLAVYERNLDWFRYWMQDYRDPDPLKADQYRRWDGLRKQWRAIRRSGATAQGQRAR